MSATGKYNLLKKIANDTISSLDLFGQAPVFRINKQTKFSTCFGFLLSLFLAIVTFTYLIMEINEMLQYSHPKVVSTQMQVVETPTYPLLSENFTLAVTVGNLQMASLKTINKHFTINMKNCIRERITNPSTNVTKVNSNCTDIPMETCTIESFQSKISQDTFKNVRLGTVQCIQKDYLKSNAPVLQGAFSALVHQYLLITLEACVNTTTKHDCSPKEEIQQGMEAGYYHIYYTDNLIRMDQPGYPFQELISQISTTFSIYSSKQIYHDFMIAEAKSDEGLVLTDYKEQYGLIAAQFREASEFYNKNYIVQHLIRLDYRNTQYNRSYLKLQTVLSKVGGFWSVVLILFALILKPLTNTLMNLSIVNKLFYFSNSNMLEEEKIKINNLVVAQSVDEIKEISKVVKSKRSTSNKLSQYHSSRFNSNKQGNNQEFKDYLDNKNKSLNFSNWDVLKSIFMCKSKKIAQFRYAQERFMSQLDIVSLIEKIHEIDKLKYILLDDDQQKIFNFMQRPTISLNLNELSNLKAEEFNNLEKSVVRNLIIQEEKPQIVKLQQAFQAYKSITKSKMFSQINKQILKLLDDDVLELFVHILHIETQTADFYNRQIEEEGENTSHQIQNEFFPMSYGDRTPNELIVNQELQD